MTQSIISTINRIVNKLFEKNDFNPHTYSHSNDNIHYILFISFVLF